MRNILLYLWQLPQNILGAAVLLFWKKDFSYPYKDVTVYGTSRGQAGVSLGKYIICRDYGDPTIPSLKVHHEYGHCIQSRRWGWLYLPTVGLVSGLRNVLHLYKRNHYFDSWPENEADRLGGVLKTKYGRRYVKD